MKTLFMAMSFCAVSAAAEPAVVKSVSVEPERVVLGLSKPAGFRSKKELLANAKEDSPAALVVTLDGAELSSEAQGERGAAGLVRHVSMSQAVEGGVPRVRVVIALDAGTGYSPVWHDADLVIALSPPPAAKATPAAAEPEPVLAAKPQPAVAAAPPAGRAYWVQFGSLRDDERAAGLRAGLEPKLGKLEIRRAEVGGKPVFRVLQGPYAARAAAAAAAEKAAAQGFKGLVIRD